MNTYIQNLHVQNLVKQDEQIIHIILLQVTVHCLTQTIHSCHNWKSVAPLLSCVDVPSNWDLRSVRSTTYIFPWLKTAKFFQNSITNLQSLNCQSCLHMGHSCCICWELSHFSMQCMWKTCVHFPQTKGQSSPGTLQSGQHPSNCILHIPHVSSLAVQCQAATAVHFFIFSFI